MFSSPLVSSSYVIPTRFVGSTWLLMRATVWRTTTVSWPRSWTPTTLRRGESSWQGRRCRTNCLSFGRCSTSSFLPSSRAAAPLSSGSTLLSPWLERRCAGVSHSYITVQQRTLRVWYVSLCFINAKFLFLLLSRWTSMKRRPSWSSVVFTKCSVPSCYAD